MQFEEFMKQCQRYKIFSSVSEGGPTHSHTPPAAEQSLQHLDLSVLKLISLYCLVCRQYLQDPCVNLLLQAWCKQPFEQLGFCPLTVLIICLCQIKVQTYLGSLSWGSSVNIPSVCPVCYWTLFQRCEGNKHPGDRS